jgi:hypothetical protein
MPKKKKNRFEVLAPVFSPNLASSSDLNETIAVILVFLLIIKNNVFKREKKNCY